MLNQYNQLRLALSSLFLSVVFIFSLVCYSQHVVEVQIVKKLEAKSDVFNRLFLSYASIDEILIQLESELVGKIFTTSSVSSTLPIILDSEVQIIGFTFPVSESQHSAIIMIDNVSLGIDLNFTHRLGWLSILLFFATSSGIYYLVLYICQTFVHHGNVSSANEEQKPNCRLRYMDLTSDEKQTLSTVPNLLGLDDRSLSWFIWAYRKTGCIDTAKRACTRPDMLEFDVANRKVLVRGIELELPKTPYFYYYWYAKRKASHQAPFTNPAVNKPDLAAGKELADIMAKYDGIERSIEELKRIGVRSKTLDLNRNKIKEKMKTELGELVEPYLFESARDPRFARYQYQLSLPSENIRFLR